MKNWAMPCGEGMLYCISGAYHYLNNEGIFFPLSKEEAHRYYEEQQGLTIEASFIFAGVAM